MSEGFLEERSARSAIYPKPMAESRVEGNLRAWRLEAFAPKIRVRRDNRLTGKPVYVTRPLFPRHTFAGFKLGGLMHKVTFARGVQNVVSFEGHPAVSDGQIIELIKSQVDEQGYVRMNALRPCDKVVIEGGLLRPGRHLRLIAQGSRAGLNLTGKCELPKPHHRREEFGDEGRAPVI